MHTGKERRSSTVPDAILGAGSAENPVQRGVELVTLATGAAEQAGACAAFPVSASLGVITRSELTRYTAIVGGPAGTGSLLHGCIPRC